MLATVLHFTKLRFVANLRSALSDFQSTNTNGGHVLTAIRYTAAVQCPGERRANSNVSIRRKCFSQTWVPSAMQRKRNRTVQIGSRKDAKPRFSPAGAEDIRFMPKSNHYRSWGLWRSKHREVRWWAATLSTGVTHVNRAHIQKVHGARNKCHDILLCICCAMSAWQQAKIMKDKSASKGLHCLLCHLQICAYYVHLLMWNFGRTRKNLKSASSKGPEFVDPQGECGQVLRSICKEQRDH